MGNDYSYWESLVSQAVYSRQKVSEDRRMAMVEKDLIRCLFDPYGFHRFRGCWVPTGDLASCIQSHSQAVQLFQLASASKFVEVRGPLPAELCMEYLIARDMGHTVKSGDDLVAACKRAASTDPSDGFVEGGSSLFIFDGEEWERAEQSFGWDTTHRVIGYVADIGMTASQLKLRAAGLKQPSWVVAKLLMLNPTIQEQALAIPNSRAVKTMSSCLADQFATPCYYQAQQLAVTGMTDALAIKQERDLREYLDANEWGEKVVRTLICLAQSGSLE